jgi:hypothetical protein
MNELLIKNNILLPIKINNIIENELVCSLFYPELTDTASSGFHLVYHQDSNSESEGCQSKV